MSSTLLSKESTRVASSPRPRSFRDIRTAAALVAVVGCLLVAGAFIAGQPYQLLVTRAVMICLAVLVGVLAVARRRDTWALLLRAFWATGSATNLALMRIASFGTLWWLVDQGWILNALDYREMWTVPASIGWMFALVPPNEAILRAAVPLCKVLCLLGVFGIFTRTNAALCALMGTYIIGVPFCLKVDHFHHVIWFLILLTAARSSDRLSLSTAFKRSLPSPEKSRHYGVPLRFAWLLLGLIYFFPGMFKLWNSGVDWIWTDILPNIVLARIFPEPMTNFQVSLPSFAWQLSALAAVLFECTFLMTVFLGDNVRAALAVAASCFHKVIAIVMGINFFHLQPFLLTLVNWHGLVSAAGVRSMHGIAPAPTQSRIPGSPLWSLVVGATLAVVQIGYGFSANIVDWPFACYPLFSKGGKGILTQYVAVLEKPGATLKSVWLACEIPSLTKSRAGHMIQLCSGYPQAHRRGILMLCQKACAGNPDWKGVESVDIFKKRMRLSKYHRDGELLEVQHLFSFSRKELLPHQ